MHLYKAHLPIRHLLNNRDFEQSNPSTRTQMSALSFYEYIEIISAHCVNTWIMNFSTCGRWPTVDCTFSNGWYSRHVSNAHVSVCMCLNWLLFYLLVAFLWNQYTHRKEIDADERESILDAWNLQSRLSCIDVKQKRLTQKKIMKGRWSIVCAVE